MPEMPAAHAAVAGPRRPGRGDAARRAGMALLVLLVVAWCCGTAAAADDAAYPADLRAKLDTFEGVALDKADAVYAKGDHARAVAEYDAFLARFPESRAVPYAILRKGRGLQQSLKRFEAIRVYQEVLDYFPDDVPFAALALYRIGECHAESGDIDKALVVWAKFAADEAYVRQPVGAAALNALAGNLIRQGRLDEGIARYEQVATTFRTANPERAREAIRLVTEHHVRTRPDPRRLRDFYVAVKTFEAKPQEPAEDAARDAVYWPRVREAVVGHGRFDAGQQAARQAYYATWAAAAAAALPDDDEQQIAAAGFAFQADGDVAAWTGKLDAHFARLQKPGDYGRVVRWVEACASHPEHMETYYAKLDFAKLSNDDITRLVLTLLRNGQPRWASSTFDKLRLDDMADDAKGRLADAMREFGGQAAAREMAVRASLACRDRNLGKSLALRYLHWRCAPSNSAMRTPADVDDALRLAAELESAPDHATRAASLAANILQWVGRYEEAIQAYRKADDPPHSLFATAECLQKLGRIEPAVAQLAEIESFFKDQAAEAALRIAYVYRDTGKDDRYVATLRGVLKKYPQSSQSSEAHQRLEELGVRIGGGVNADGT
jgi:tetratricopeptide (TPR) repeat protein